MPVQTAWQRFTQITFRVANLSLVSFGVATSASFLWNFYLVRERRIAWEAAHPVETARYWESKKTEKFVYEADVVRSREHRIAMLTDVLGMVPGTPLSDANNNGPLEMEASTTWLSKVFTNVGISSRPQQHTTTAPTDSTHNITPLVTENKSLT